MKKIKTRKVTVLGFISIHRSERIKKYLKGIKQSVSIFKIRFYMVVYIYHCL